LKTKKSSLIAIIVLVSIGILLAVEAGCFLYNPDRFALSEPFGVLDIIRGNVSIMKKNSMTWEKAADGLILEADAVITFTRGTTTKLEPGTDLIIDRIQESSGAQPFTVVLKQQTGKTWNQVDKADGKASFQIKTGTADITVHGTLFSTEVDETGKTMVQTTEGKVGVSAGGTEVQVPAGKMTEVKPNEKPSAPAAIPQAINELIIKIDQYALGMVENPDGASIGYLKSGAKINQISGSTVSAIGESGQTIRIREPEAGEYTLTLRGVTDATGEVTVEGIVGGKSAFMSIESCNITAAKDTLLKLHYNVIEGLLLQADESNQALASVLENSADNANIKTVPADNTKTIVPLAEKEKSPDQGFSWSGIAQYDQLTRWISVGCFLLLIGIVLLIMRRQN
jgi:hypothetical protein